jgi:hypothetical protein
MYSIMMIYLIDDPRDETDNSERGRFIEFIYFRGDPYEVAGNFDSVPGNFDKI